MNTAGVLGGFGPETTAEFYISVVNKNKKLNTHSHPSILIHNIPVPFQLEEDAVKNAKNLEKFLPLLLESTRALQSKADFIVLPCNTLHIFIDDIKRASKVPVLSIIDEVVNEVKNRKLSRIGLLATLKTFKEGLYETKLKEDGIQLIKPGMDDQKKLSRIIHLILKGVKSDDLKIELLSMVNDLRNRGAEEIILGCTDLQILIKPNDSPLRLIETMDVLADSTVKVINKPEAIR